MNVLENVWLYGPLSFTDKRLDDALTSGFDKQFTARSLWSLENKTNPRV